MARGSLEFSQYLSIWANQRGAYHNHKETMAHLGMALYLAGSIGFALKAEYIVDAIGFLPSLIFGAIVTLAAFYFVHWQFKHREWIARIIDASGDVSAKLLSTTIGSNSLACGTLEPYDRLFPRAIVDRAKQLRAKDKFWKVRGVGGSQLPVFFVMVTASILGFRSLLTYRRHLDMDWYKTVVAIGALGTLIAAICAARSVGKARRAIDAQALLHLVDRYYAHDMLDGILALHQWKKEHPDDFAGTFGALRQNNYEEVKLIDRARRQYTGFFQKIMFLSERDIVSDEFVKMLIPVLSVTTLIEIVEPLEKAIRNKYDKTLFNWFRDKYRDELQRGEGEF